MRPQSLPDLQATVSRSEKPVRTYVLRIPVRKPEGKEKVSLYSRKSRVRRGSRGTLPRLLKASPSANSISCCIPILPRVMHLPVIKRDRSLQSVRVFAEGLREVVINIPLLTRFEYFSLSLHPETIFISAYSGGGYMGIHNYQVNVGLTPSRRENKQNIRYRHKKRKCLRAFSCQIRNH